MAKLIAKGGDLEVSPIDLQDGINTLGRAEGNHHIIRHVSVSSRHCEIVRYDGTVTVRDLGSTNGTFVDGQPVQHANLSHGQRLRLGGVEFVLEAPHLAAAPPIGTLRVHATPSPPPTPAPGRTAAQMVAALQPAALEVPSFYLSLPGAFAYPFKKSGLLLLVIGAILFMGLDFFSSISRPSVPGGIRVTRFSLLISIISIGYLYAIMQKIIVHSAQGDDETPDFPGLTEWWSDILQPFLFLLGVFLVSFLPGLALLLVSGDNVALKILSIAVLCFGAFYFPMALLAVAVSDNFVALSPHIVVPSLFRVFLPYTVAFLMLATLFALRLAGGWVAHLIPLEAFFWKLLATVIMGLVSLYLLTVNMRVLGLLFRSYRARLGWLG